ncbi:MAG: hypothetical protein NT121_00370 [Chloroflexi bacterium]|nr:hypothetical protein [Chloroflexota bacterium]
MCAPGRRKHCIVFRSLRASVGKRAESQRFVRTPLVELLNDATLPDQLKRDLLFAQYLRATPLVWQALSQGILPLLETQTQSLAQNGLTEVPQADLDDFLQKHLRKFTAGTFAHTRVHITAHLMKFGLLEARAVPGDRISKHFFAHYYQPDMRAFWFVLAQEFAEQGWTSRSEQFICERSWTRTAFCASSAYARFAMDEAEKHEIAALDFFGSEKQFTLRGPDPWARLLEAIRYA